MDLVIGGQGNDLLIGSELDDFIVGLAGDDTLQGEDGNDILVGYAGNDTLIGGRGSDIFVGNEGDDRMIWNNGDGSDLMNGGEGIDVVEVNGSIDEGDQFVLQANQQGQAIFDRLNLVPFTLTVYNAEQFQVNGGGGDDSFTVQDLTGTDVTSVTFSGGDGNDTFDASASAVAVVASGDAGDDILIGSSVNDQLGGGDGNDTIVGFRGSDTFEGGAGDDRMIWNNGDGSDLMNGGEGIDVVEVNGATEDGDEFVLQANQQGQAIFDRVNLVPFTLTVDDAEQFEVNGGGGDDSFTVQDLTGTDVTSVTFSGGDANDIFNASATAVAVVASGDAGDDILTGGAANDQLWGGDGNDTIVGFRGSDTFEGGAGDDRMIWNNGDGSDLMNGGEGIDVVEVNGATEDGDEFVLQANQQGQAIFDRVNLVPFTLTVDNAELFEVNGGGGDDSFTVQSLSGTDVLSVTFSGGDGNDTFDASATAVAVVANGDAGNDILIGGAADDLLIGGDGSDILVGGGGNDTLIGGNGSTQFSFATGDAFATSNAGVDTIENFESGTDTISLSASTFTVLTSLNAALSTASDFAMVSTDAEAATTDAYIVYSMSTGNLYYNQNGSVEGYGTGDLFATIANPTSISEADIQIIA